MTTMPFGKHKGESLADIPTDYLEWLLTIELRPWLKQAVKGEIRSRRERQESRWKPPPPPAKLDIAAWHRRLSMRFHPDHGGSKEAMQAVNAGRDLLEQMTKPT